MSASEGEIEVIRANREIKKPLKAGGENLEDCLLMLAQYGRPRLSKQDSGWYCTIKMFVVGKGVEFEISSEFKHHTPLEAVNTVILRLVKVLEDLKSA